MYSSFRVSSEYRLPLLIRISLTRFLHMKTMNQLVWCFMLITYSPLCYGQAFEVPDATVEVFSPRGLRVSIPDVEGIKLFAFHGKINEEMNGREAGFFSRDIVKAKNGRWTFYDSQAKLNIGDILYYWTYADYFDGERKLGYTQDDQLFTVTELLPKPGSNPTIPVTKAPIDGCRPSITTVKGQSSCQGKLIFDSNFAHYADNKDQLWMVHRKYATGPDYEFVIYQDNLPTLSVENDKLVIMPVLTDSMYGDDFVTGSEGLDLGKTCTGVRASSECYQVAQAWYIIPPVISSQLTTKKKFSFKYGKVEIRAKLPKGDWLYPELFLNSENEEYGRYYDSGQIRIAFTNGNQGDNQQIQGGVILGPETQQRKFAMKSIHNTKSWTEDFHNFTVLWTPESIISSVDNVVFSTVTPPAGGFSSLTDKLRLTASEKWKGGNKIAPFDKEMHLVIGVGAGGHNFEDRSDGSKPWKNDNPLSQKNFYRARGQWFPTWGRDAKLTLDYVKVWALEA
ncbi:unnamed protein product [Ceutorhynchus assimilis]|uniref:Beta-1,3-glucan-binding protein n=1 Tax=Ceutorhynchus assimilis TaxID=467358 RepID=A0A9N9QNJ8_9CUCU|nr:unnamed protein product [Ceutorhynchus assimilis]